MGQDEFDPDHTALASAMAKRFENPLAFSVRAEYLGLTPLAFGSEHKEISLIADMWGAQYRQSFGTGSFRFVGNALERFLPQPEVFAGA